MRAGEQLSTTDKQTTKSTATLNPESINHTSPSFSREKATESKPSTDQLTLFQAHPSSLAPSALAALTLAACGGGGGSNGSSAGSGSAGTGSGTGGAMPSASVTPVASSGQEVRMGAMSSFNEAEASRFLAQASMGCSQADIRGLVASGATDWLSAQLTMTRSTSLFDWMSSQLVPGATVDPNNTDLLDRALWKSLIDGPDTLRQRIAFALSEIFVINFTGLGTWRAWSGATFMDVLLDHAFGNFRALLEAVTKTHAMAVYLTYLGNRKANPSTGTLPDENYAREIMQLFTIGLYQLNMDGTLKTANGRPIETYSQEDVLGLARVFTGWVTVRPLNGQSTQNDVRAPLIQNPAFHETGEKRFLGVTISSGTDGATSLGIALDTLFNHPNTAPFICKQLIQRLVTSNPSPAFIQRVAEVFANDGRGVRGNLGQVIVAILQDPEARTVPTQPGAGKLREPVLRFIQWARAFKGASPDGTWSIAQTSDATALNQSPLRSPSVFNFFRPGYTPPNTTLAANNLLAPEFQIVDEVSIASYINYMQRAIENRLGGIRADYSDWLSTSNDPVSLVNQLSLVLTNGYLSGSSVNLIAQAIGTIPSTRTNYQTLRVQSAILLIMASPEYLTLV